MVGEWLLGDGESGLCSRLKKKNHLIGWAPESTDAALSDSKEKCNYSGYQKKIYEQRHLHFIIFMQSTKKEKNALIRNMLYTFKQGIKWSIKKLNIH